MGTTGLVFEHAESEDLSDDYEYTINLHSFPKLHWWIVV
jgi:hypothetical protein